MKIKSAQRGWVAFCFWIAVGMTACQTSTAPTDSPTTPNAPHNRSAPQRVDVRGSIIMKRYSQGQVVLEVEGTPSQHTRYNRAFVLVLPTTQIIDSDGSSSDLNQLQQGQTVAILLRSGGKGNLVGMGVARKMWIEEVY